MNCPNTFTNSGRALTRSYLRPTQRRTNWRQSSRSNDASSAIEYTPALCDRVKTIVKAGLPTEAISRLRHWTIAGFGLGLWRKPTPRLDG